MKQYLIVTHDYLRQSAGVRALHKLCHYLNLTGCDAYVTSEIRNDDWVTPLATPELQAEIAQSGIVVYPEVEAGNKLNAVQVVRYLLNVPGRIRGDTKFPATEQLFAYSGLLRRYVHNPRNILTIPVIDRSIFKSDGFDPHVMSVVFWVGKGKETLQVKETIGATEITNEFPGTWPELAQLFRGARLFISYATYTMLTIEARLCGCPTVVVPNGLWTKEEFERAAPGINGLAWGTDKAELARARRTVKQFQQDYTESVTQFYTQLDHFVDKTQGWK